MNLCLLKATACRLVSSKVLHSRQLITAGVTTERYDISHFEKSVIAFLKKTIGLLLNKILKKKIIIKKTDACTVIFRFIFYEWLMMITAQLIIIFFYLLIPSNIVINEVPNLSFSLIICFLFWYFVHWKLFYFLYHLLMYL